MGAEGAREVEAAALSLTNEEERAMYAATVRVTTEELKALYRRPYVPRFPLCLKPVEHPDVALGDPAALAKIREICEGRREIERRAGRRKT